MTRPEEWMERHPFLFAMGATVLILSPVPLIAGIALLLGGAA